MDINRLDPSDKFDRVLGVALEAEMRPGAEKICQQYLRGILTVNDAIRRMQELERSTQESELWRNTA